LGNNGVATTSKETAMGLFDEMKGMAEAAEKAA